MQVSIKQYACDTYCKIYSTICPWFFAACFPGCRAVCPLFCACVRLELLLFNQDRQNLLTIFVSHESWHKVLLCYFCFQFQSHQKLANFATFTTQFCKQFQNDNSVTNMALKLKQKRLSGQCHLNFKVSFQLSHKFVFKNSV